MLLKSRNSNLCCVTGVSELRLDYDGDTINTDTVRNDLIARKDFL